MREIRFRAYDKKLCKMFFVKILNVFTGMQVNFGIKYSVSDGKGLTCKNPTELMQFTGLVDKQGKEIYEGDIYKEQFGNIFTIKFVAPSFNLCEIDTEKGEVIGNIYENPDLLKVPKEE